MKTKLLSLFVALWATTALWAYDFKYGDLYYNIKGDGMAEVTYESWDTLRNYVGLTVANIPESVTYNGKTYCVTSIDKAFMGCRSLTSITIPNSVTSIGCAAFNDCSGLTSITIPNSVTSIGRAAFSGCSGLTSITIPNDVTSIGDYAFSDCSGLTSITIPNDVTSIGDYAFFGCNSLASITLPNSVTSIGERAFDGTSWLNNQPDGEIYLNNVLYQYKGSMPYGTNIVVKEGTTCICGHAFYGYRGLTSITIPNNVTSIGGSAFYGCSSLTSITIPNNVTSIGNHAFSGCSGLISITIGNGVTSIGDKAFRDCSGLKSIEWNAKNYADFTIDDTPFYHKGRYSSDNFDLRAQITSFVFGDSVQNIPAYICSGMTKLASVIVPNSVTKIGEEAFSACWALTYVLIGNSITNIGNHAFSGCGDIQKIKVAATNVPNIDAGTFNYVGNKMIALYVPVQSVSEYKTHPIWGKLGRILAIHTHVLIQTNDSLAGIIYGDTLAYYGDTIQICAVANYGYHFNSWSDRQEDSTHMNACRNICVPYISDDSIGYTAYFFKNRYTIQAHSDTTYGYALQNGTQIPYLEYNYLDTIILTAVPKVGCLFKQWNDGCLLNPRTIVLERDTAFTAEFSIVYSGNCGDSLYWAYANHNLTISGNNDMYDYSAVNMPWVLLRDTISTITLERGISHIGNNAFNGITQLNKVELPHTLTSIGENAFRGCRTLFDIYSYAIEPPIADNSSFANYNVTLHIPCDNLRAYQTDAVFGSFKYIQCIGAENTDTDDDVTVTPSDNNAVFTWPADGSADSYTLQITKDGEVFCTLVFNANGQLNSIAFAPTRNGSQPQRAAEQTTKGFRFTVTGLSEQTHYAFEIAVKDKESKTLQTYSGEFNTISSVDASVSDTESESSVSVRKIFHDGQVFIIRGNKTYTLIGEEVK